MKSSLSSLFKALIFKILNVIDIYVCVCVSHLKYIIYAPIRFFRQFLVSFGLHIAGMSMFRLVSSVSQTIVAATTAGTLVLVILSSFGGFIVTQRNVISCSPPFDLKFIFLDKCQFFSLQFFPLLWLQHLCLLG